MAVRMSLSERSEQVCLLENQLRESQARERNLREINAALMLLVEKRSQVKEKSELEAEKEQLVKEMKDDRKRAEAQQDALLSQIRDLRTRNQELKLAYQEMQKSQEKELKRLTEKLRNAENERNSMKCALESLEKDYS
jgi:hypothetical protein